MMIIIVIITIIFYCHFLINPLVPGAHYSERQDKKHSLQIHRLEVDLKLDCGFLFCTLGTNGLIILT